MDHVCISPSFLKTLTERQPVLFMEEHGGILLQTRRPLSQQCLNYGNYQRVAQLELLHP
jgi:hypothetical protein